MRLNLALIVVTLSLLQVNQIYAKNLNRSAQETVILSEKYSGSFADLEKHGYNFRSGMGGGRDLNTKLSAVITAYCRPFRPSESHDCVFVIQPIESRDTHGHALYSQPHDMLHVKLPKGWDYFDSGDSGCTSTKYPEADIISVGRWSWHKKPAFGGYAHSLKKAWRVDYDLMKLVEISTQGITCEFDDDRD